MNMSTTEIIENLYRELEPYIDKCFFLISPTMHKRVFMVGRFTSLFPEPKRKLRKVQMRRWLARRKAMRAHFEYVYHKRYT